MKIIRTIILVAGIVFSPCLLHAQTLTVSGLNNVAAPVQSAAPDSIVQVTAEAQGLQLVSPDNLPPFGTYWEVMPYGVMAPLPCQPFDPTLPVFAITDNIFLVDATGGQLAVNPRQTAAMSTAAAVNDATASLATEVVNLINQVQTAQANQQARATMQAMGMDVPSPGDSGGGDGGSYSPMFSGGTPINTNGLWLQITNYDGNFAYVNLNNATDQVYAVWTTTNLLTPWRVEAELWPTTAQTNVLPFTVPTLGQPILFVRAEDWTGVTANGNQTPQWWFFYWFGEAGLSLSDNTLDSSGNTLLSDYQNHNDPNIIQFYIEPASDYVNTTNASVQLYITAGEPAYYAVLVNGQTTTNWLPFTTSNIMVNLGPTDGVYNVAVGLKGIPTNATQTWQEYSLTLDRVPPILTITNPISANATVIKPYLQLQGYANKPLSRLSYGISNAMGVLYSLPGYVTDQVFDTNQFDFTTNFFQCFDVPLTNGINNITLSVSDWAGNITTTNFNVILNYTSATNPPVVKLIWPQNGMAVSGTNITLRGTMSDETGTIVGQVVDQDGDTNVLSGIVERNGMFWIENLPLTNGNNTVTVTATDAAGNVTTTNITISESGMVLTINSTPTGDALYQPSGTVYGTVSDPTAAVSVNGVAAVMDGSGNWEADNVPIYGMGTATFDAVASNSTTTANASSAVEMPAYAAIVQYDCTWNGSYGSNGNTNAWTHTKDYSAQYQPNTNGQWASTYSGSREDTDNFTGGWYDDDYNWSSADPANYYDHHTGDIGQEYYATNAIDQGLDEGGFLTGVPDQTLQDGWGDLNYHYFGSVSYSWQGSNVLQGNSSISAHTQVKLYTGGKAGINRQNLFCLGCSAQGYGQAPYVGDQDTPWFDMPAIPIDVTSLTVMGQHPGADGNLWVALPDNSPGIDITVTAPSKHYNAWAAPTKYDLSITLNGIDLTTNTPTFCVGQSLTFVLAGLPMSQIVNMVGKWNLPGKFVNEGYQYSAACYSYRLDSTLLLNTNTTSCWYQNKPGGTVTVGMDLLFNNGLTCPVAANGSFNIVRPTVSNLVPDTNMYVVLDTNSAPEIYLGLGDSGGGGMGWVLTANLYTNFSGALYYEQLINRDWSWDKALGFGLINESTVTGSYWLDNGIPYGAGSAYGDTNTPKPHSQLPMVFGDGPSLTDRLYSYASLQDQFETYVEFQPVGGIPVTIGLVNWGWYGRTDGSYTTSIWILTGQSITGPTLDAGNDTFPVYPEVYYNSGN